MEICSAMPPETNTRPRVLMLCNDRRIDRRILLQADSLEADGWTVQILAMPLDEPGVDDARVIRLGRAGVALGRRSRLIMRTYRRIRESMSMNGVIMRGLKRLAWRHLVDPERFYTDLYLDSARQLMPARVVVAHDLPMLAVGRRLAAEYDAALVYDSHELYCEQEFSGSEKRRWAAIEKRDIGACGLVITVNPSIAGELQRRYALARVEVIYNAERVGTVPARSYYLHDRMGLERSDPILLYQGGFSAGRHLLTLIRAMALTRRIDVRLVLMGEGQLRAAMVSLIKRLRLQDRVFLHPLVEQQALLSITGSADAGIIPYQPHCLNNYYCTPNKLFEFVAAGIPILASDLPELNRLIAGSDIGRVEDLTSAGQMAASIDRFFELPSTLQRWRNNLQTVRQHLSWQTESTRLVSLYGAFK
jgi:glycosyltransferase involved in cell wall biosynthesis